MSTTLVDDARDRAFERLYARHVRDVYRYVLSIVRNPAEAEDVTQTTFLNAYRAIQAGAEPHAPQNWLIAIAHNACRSRVRFAMRRPREVPLDDVTELAMHEPERLNIRELLRAFGRLPSNQRTALTLREFEGRSYPEIAETLGVTVPAVEALIVRARQTLRRQATTLRGALAAFLPRTGELGAGTAAKAAALLAVGVVAGGVGRPEAATTHPERVVPSTAAVPVVPAVARHVRTATHRRVVLGKRNAHPVTTRAHPALETASPTIAAPTPGPAPAAPPSTPPATAQSTPAGRAAPVPDPPVSLPVAVPDPPVPLPNPPDLPVQAPSLPSPPQLPPLPAQVFPGSGI